MIETIELGEVLQYEQPTNYIVESDRYNDEFKTPVLTAGKSFVLGYTNETKNIYTNLPVIIFDDFTTATKFVDFPFKVKSSAMKILSCDENIADIKYLFYLIQTIKINSEQHQRYWISKFSKIKIPLPPLSTQKEIAEKLDKADVLRKKDQELLAQYDELAQAIFIDMFGDPVKNEKGWEKSKLENLMQIRRGASPRPIDKFIGEDVNWIKIGDATDGDNIYIDSSKVKITFEGAKKSVFLKKGSMIFANCGVSLGFSRILNIDGCIHDGWLSFENIQEEKINKLYLLKAINFLTEYFRQTAPDGTQPNLNTNIMKNFEISVPPLSLQNQFVQKIKNIEAQKALAKKQAQESEDLFQALLQESFNFN